MRASLAVIGLLLAATGCGSDDDPSSGGDPSPSTSSSVAATTTTVDGRFPVGAGYTLAIRCLGQGSPVVLLEPGTDGSGLEENGALIEPLAETTQTTVCTYDRVGFGANPPPSKPRRTLDDASADLHDLVAAAGLAPPYLLVGPSGGGLLAVNYAGLYPEQVVGLVLLDVPAPVTDLDEEFPGALGWKNPEHLDYVDAERTLALHPPSLDEIPVSVVTATDGASSVKDQSVWLALSTDSRQTTLDGEHDLTSANQSGVIAEIQAAVDAVRSDT